MATLVSSTGAPEEVPDKDVETYLQMGYQRDTPELAAKRAEQQKYGEGLANEAKAFGAAALRAPTLGLSDPILESLGADREGLQKRAEYNPNATTAGEFAGLGAALLAPGLGEFADAGALGKAGAALQAPMEATTALGKGVGSITKKLLAGTPKAVGELGAGAADTAVQAAIFNAAQKIDENHLAGGNLQQGVENALASTGDALAFGAALHGVTALAGKGLVYGAQKSLDGLQTLLREKVLPKVTEGAADAFASVSSAATGEPIENFAKYTGPEGAAGRKELLDIKPPPTLQEQADLKDKMTSELQAKLKDALRDGNELAYKGKGSGNKFGDIIPEERKTLLGQADKHFAIAKAMELSNYFTEKAQLLASDEVEYAPIITKRLKKIYDRFDTELGDMTKQTSPVEYTAEDVYNLLEKTKQQIAQRSKFNAALSLEQKNAAGVMADVGGQFKRALEDPQVWGEQGARQAAINDATARYISLTEKKGAFYQDFLRETKHGAGRATKEIDETKVSTMMNKPGSARGQRQLRAIQEFLTATQDMIEQHRISGSNVGIDLGHEKYLKSLADTAAKFEHEEQLKSLGSTQQTIEGASGITQEAVEKLGAQSRMRGLANSPFVTAVEPVKLGGLVGSTVSKAINTARNPVEGLRTIARLERFNETTSKRIQAGINSFFKGADKAGGKAFESVRPVISYEADKPIAYQKELTKRAAEYSDPQVVAAKYHAALQETEEMPGVQSPIAEHAPQFTKRLADKQTQIAQFLWDIYPKDQSQVLGVAGGKFSKYQPSKAELADYREKEQVATNPLIVKDKLLKGTLTADDMKIVDKLWPEIGQQIRNATLVKMGELKHDLTGKQKQQLSVLFGHPVDEWQDSATGQLVQKNFADQMVVKKAAAAKAAQGLSELADSKKTASQRLVK